jgi:hypothetical protein
MSVPPNPSDGAVVSFVASSPCAGTIGPPLAPATPEDKTTGIASTDVTSLSDDVGQPLTFDLGWSAVACGGPDLWADYRWVLEFDHGGTCAEVIHRGHNTLTLRGARPLPRPPHATTASFRVIVVDYSGSKYFTLGFVPEGATPVLGQEICEYGGWEISVSPSRWRPLLYSSAFAPLTGDPDAEESIIPPVPPGAAVEFTVDYTAHTCHVSFYTPANARNFAATPYAAAVLRFAPTVEYGRDPARSDPTAPDTCVTLYPAVNMRSEGAIVCFASAGGRPAPTLP